VLALSKSPVLYGETTRLVAALRVAVFVLKLEYGFCIAVFICVPIFRLGAIIPVLLEKFKICDFLV
jgi:hypothetical protein